MPRLVEVPRELEVQPELSLHPERLLEPESGIGRHATLAVNELVDARVRRADPRGELCLSDAERFEELRAQHFSGVSGRPACRNSDRHLNHRGSPTALTSGASGSHQAFLRGPRGRLPWTPHVSGNP